MDPGAGDTALRDGEVGMKLDNPTSQASHSPLPPARSYLEASGKIVFPRLEHPLRLGGGRGRDKPVTRRRPGGHIGAVDRADEARGGRGGGGGGHDGGGEGHEVLEGLLGSIVQVHKDLRDFGSQIAVNRAPRTCKLDVLDRQYVFVETHLRRLLLLSLTLLGGGCYKVSYTLPLCITHIVRLELHLGGTPTLSLG